MLSHLQPWSPVKAERLGYVRICYDIFDCTNVICFLPRSLHSPETQFKRLVLVWATYKLYSDHIGVGVADWLNILSPDLSDEL